MSDALIFAGEDLPCEIHGTHNCECFAADLFRGFHHFSGAWYANANHLQPGIEDIVDFGMYCADGSGDGGGAMVWYAQGPRIEIFHDGWSMIVGMSDLISTLGNLQNKRITPAEFCDILTALGFRDLTARERTASDFGGAHQPARYAYYQATGFEQTIGAYVAELDARRWYRCQIVGAAKDQSVRVSFDLGYTEIEIDVLVASLHTSAPASADVVNEEKPHAVQ